MQDISSTDFVVNNSARSVSIKGDANVPGMLLVYASWCGHCQRFMPEYQKFADAARGKGYRVYRIESAKLNPAISALIGVQGYPTLKFVLPDGKIGHSYTGPRTVESLKSTICLYQSICSL